MTAIITTNLASGYLLLHGDTVVTYITDDKTIDIPEGLTSTQEKMLPSEVNGSIHYYLEDACKIGILSPKLSCAIAGDSFLAYEVLKPLYELGQDISSREDLSNLIKGITKSLEPVDSFVNCSCIFQFVANFEKLYSLRVILSVDHKGMFSHSFMSYDNHTFPWQNTDGSGVNLFQGYFPNGIKASIDADKTLDTISNEMIAADYINFIRFKNLGEVKGVGGIVLGLKHDMHSIKYMGDFIFMFADYRGSIEFLVKVIYREGLFLITDFINKHVQVLRTIEAELEYQLGRQTKTDVTEYVREALTYQAPLALLDIRSKEEPFNPDVSIVEDRINGIVKKMELDIKFDDGFPYFPKGTELTITTKGGTHTLVIKKS